MVGRRRSADWLADGPLICHCCGRDRRAHRFSGGRGGVTGGIFGVLFLSMLTNIIIALKVNAYWQQLLHRTDHAGQRCARSDDFKQKNKNQERF